MTFRAAHDPILSPLGDEMLLSPNPGSPQGLLFLAAHALGTLVPGGDQVGVLCSSL